VLHGKYEVRNHHVPQRIQFYQERRVCGRHTNYPNNFPCQGKKQEIDSQ
jgi:hypothetical protein